MVYLGPVGRVAPDGKSIVEVAEEVTDEDLEWLNRYALDSVRYQRAWPVVEIRPDPRISQQILR